MLPELTAEKIINNFQTVFYTVLYAAAAQPAGDNAGRRQGLRWLMAMCRTLLEKRLTWR